MMAGNIRGIAIDQFLRNIEKDTVVVRAAM